MNLSFISDILKSFVLEQEKFDYNSDLNKSVVL